MYMLKRMLPILGALALVLLPHLFSAMSKWHGVPIDHGMPTGPSDPDSWLRLTLVRWWMMGGNWYDHTVWTSNAPFTGIASPWTRPLDVVIAAFAHLQPASVDISIRLARAALLLPVLWMGLMLLGIYRIVRVFTPLNSALLMASIFASCTPMIWNYFGTGNADHHAPMAALFIWAIGLVFIPHPSRWLIVLSGVMLGLQLWISVETLMLIGAMYGWYGVQWLRDGKEAARPLPLFATIIAVCSLAAVLIERPVTQWLMPVYDSISVVYVFILALSACLAWVLYLPSNTSWRLRLMVGTIGSALLLAAVHAVYPLMFKGPMALADPYIFTDFLPHVLEAQPLWKSPLPQILGMLLLPLSAIALCAASWLRPRYAFYSKQVASPLLTFLVITCVLFIAQVRWCYYLYPLVAAALAPVFAALFNPTHPFNAGRWPAQWIGRMSERAQALHRLPLLLGIIVLPVALTLLTSSYEEHINGNIESALSRRNHACQLTTRQLIYNGELRRVTGNAPRIIFASTNVGAEILFWTPLRIVASNYHREGSGIKYVWSAYDITDMKALRAHLKERRIEWMLLCPVPEPVKGSVLQALHDGAKLPGWLKKVRYTLPTEDPPLTPVAGSAPLLLIVKP